MICEFPQAENCCWKLSLRVGVIIIVCIRIFLLLLVILFGTKVLTLGEDNDKGSNDSLPKECYKLYNQHSAELVLLTVTIVLIVLWLLLMIPTVIWEILSLILIGSLLEIIICGWFFFIAAYQFSLCIVKETISFLLIFSLIWLVLECYILWIMLSYYVDVKELLRQQEGRGHRASTDSDSPS